MRKYFLTLSELMTNSKVIGDTGFFLYQKINHFFSEVSDGNPSGK